MDKIEAQILQYTLLSEVEQQAVEAYVEDHPQFAPLLESAKVFGQHVRASQRLFQDPLSDEMVAYYVATRHLGEQQQAQLPEALQNAFDRIEAQLQAQPERMQQYEAFQARLHELEAAGDAVSQFEQLSGHRLSPPVADKTLPLRPVTPLYRVALRWAVAASLVFFSAYAILFLISEGLQSDLQRLAAYDAASLKNERVVTRGKGVTEVPEDLQIQTSFYAAMNLLYQARSSRLGLFPTYNPHTLRAAEALLEEVTDAEEEGSFMSLDAYFYLGKIRLHLGNIEDAKVAFQIVVDREGNKASQAREILIALSSLSVP